MTSQKYSDAQTTGSEAKRSEAKRSDRDSGDNSSTTTSTGATRTNSHVPLTAIRICQTRALSPSDSSLALSRTQPSSPSRAALSQLAHPLQGAAAGPHSQIYGVSVSAFRPRIEFYAPVGVG